MLSVKTWSGLSILVKLYLNGIDLCFAFFLVFGGLAAIDNHAITGSICVIMAPVLIFLSAGVWTADRQKLIAHAALYWAAFIIFGGSAGFLAAIGALRNAMDNSILFAVLTAILISALLSTIQVRHLSTRSSSRH